MLASALGRVRDHRQMAETQGGGRDPRTAGTDMQDPVQKNAKRGRRLRQILSDDHSDSCAITRDSVPAQKRAAATAGDLVTVTNLLSDAPRGPQTAQDASAPPRGPFLLVPGGSGAHRAPPLS